MLDFLYCERNEKIRMYVAQNVPRQYGITVPGEMTSPPVFLTLAEELVPVK
jgi:hypothetical protein